jgi:hypothetical protein
LTFDPTAFLHMKPADQRDRVLAYRPVKNNKRRKAIRRARIAASKGKKNETI